MGSAAQSFSHTIDRTPEGLLQVGGFVDEIAAGAGLNQPTEYALRLCLEEAVGNLVMHASPASPEVTDSVTLHVTAAPGALHATIEDRCIPFDPRAAPTPVQPARLQDAGIGGLGIHLMRQYATDIAYVSDGTYNRLSLTIRTPLPRSGGG